MCKEPPPSSPAPTAASAARSSPPSSSAPPGVRCCGAQCGLAESHRRSRSVSRRRALARRIGSRSDRCPAAAGPRSQAPDQQRRRARFRLGPRRAARSGRAKPRGQLLCAAADGLLGRRDQAGWSLRFLRLPHPRRPAVHFLEAVAASRLVADFCAKQSYAESATRWQSSALRHCNAAYCLAASPAGNDVSEPLSR